MIQKEPLVVAVYDDEKRKSRFRPVALFGRPILSSMTKRLFTERESENASESMQAFFHTHAGDAEVPWSSSEMFGDSFRDYSRSRAVEGYIMRKGHRALILDKDSAKWGNMPVRHKTNLIKARDDLARCLKRMSKEGERADRHVARMQRTYAKLLNEDTEDQAELIKRAAAGV